MKLCPLHCHLPNSSRVRFVPALLTTKMAYTRSLFSGPLNLKLIELVKDNPVLYNPSHPKYSSFEARELAWNTIGESLQRPARKCKERWSNLRDTMRRKVADRHKNSELQYKCYRYEEELTFMIPFFKEMTNDNSEWYDDNTEDQPSEDYADETLNLEDNDNRNEVSTFRICNNEVASRKFNPVFCQKLDTSDPVDVFLMTMRSTLRKFRPYYLNQAKSQIFQTVQDYELKQIDDDDDKMPVTSRCKVATRMK